jgi:hypothetical protein
MAKGWLGVAIQSIESGRQIDVTTIARTIRTSQRNNRLLDRPSAATTRFQAKKRWAAATSWDQIGRENISTNRQLFGDDRDCTLNANAKGGLQCVARTLYSRSAWRTWFDRARPINQKLLNRPIVHLIPLNSVHTLLGRDRDAPVTMPTFCSALMARLRSGQYRATPPSLFGSCDILSNAVREAL